MAKILLNNEFYNELPPNFFYESQYEKIIESHSKFIYPEYYFIPFKIIVSDGVNSAKPDYALIHKTFNHWWVVEIELIVHQFADHVIKQTKIFNNGIYTKEHGEYLLKNSKISLDKDKLYSMLKGLPPKILVVVNKYDSYWAKSLDIYNIYMNVIEVFLSSKNDFMFRINGYTPNIMFSKNIISICYFDKLLRNFLKIETPALLPITHNEKIEIYYNDYITTWKRLDTNDNVWLTPQGNNPLYFGKKYTIINVQNKYFFEELTKIK